VGSTGLLCRVVAWKLVSKQDEKTKTGMSCTHSAHQEVLDKYPTFYKGCRNHCHIHVCTVGEILEVSESLLLMIMK
jgi:hypothetical protein